MSHGSQPSSEDSMAELLDDPFKGLDPDNQKEMPFVPEWSENQLELETLLDYFHSDTLVPVGRVALPPPGQVPVSIKVYQRKVLTYEPDERKLTVIGPSGGQWPFVAIVFDKDDEYIDTYHYNEAPEVGSVGQKIYSAVRENAKDPDYIRDREDDREMEVIYYPRGYITFSTILLSRVGWDHAKELEGFRLCTTQLAMDLYFKLIKAEVYVEPLPAEKQDKNGLPEKSAMEDDEGNGILEDSRIQDDITRFRVCARIDVESRVKKRKGFRYRKVTAWRPGDHTVIAYFRKLGASSPWEQIDVEKFNKRVQRLTHIERQVWIFRMEKYNSDGTGELGKGGGTMYLTNGITGDSYYILDPEYVLDGCDLSIGITARRTFGGDQRLQWTMVTQENLFGFRGRNIRDDHRPTLSLWLQLSNGNSIQDRVVVKRFVSNSLRRMDREQAKKIVENQMDLFSRVGLFRGSALRGDETTTPKDRYVLFLEYCPAGNMRSLVQYLKKEKSRLPEPFLWLLFLNLVKDCMHIENVRRVHKKLTLRHILLRNKPVTGKWIAYPSPVVGNFGSLDLIGDVKSSGVKGFLTPEHLKARHKSVMKHGLGRPIDGSKLHTFAIGICIWSAMRLSETGLPDDEQAYEDQFVLPYEKTSPMDDHSIYSTRLEHLVKDCLHHDPGERPSLRALKRCVTEGIMFLKQIKPDVDTRSEDELPKVDRVPIPTDHLPLGGNYSAIQNRKKNDKNSPDPSERHFGSASESSTADDNINDDN